MNTELQNKGAQGLRARKKARTFHQIQSNALHLFTEKGFANTTVEEIAEASDISPSTFFRYFPTKEDIILYDSMDTLLITAFNSQPASLNPLQAMRKAMAMAFSQLPKEELSMLQKRQELIAKLPELRGKMLEELLRNVTLITDLVSQRLGAKADDIAIRMFAGAFMGVSLAAIAEVERTGTFDSSTYQKDFNALLDEFEKRYHARF